jgi:hypothetical protein
MELDMKASIALIAVGCVALSGPVLAQSSSSPPDTSSQERPDARYPNPSGQDSNPSSTKVEPTKTAPPSKKPQDSSRGEAAKETYVDGKKRDVAGGCSTPTDAASAKGTRHTARPDEKDKTVCTTSGEGTQSAKEPRVASQDEKPKASPQQKPPPKPR